MDDSEREGTVSPVQRGRGRGRGRRPAGEVRAEVLEAAAGVLFADGMAAVTFERVAEVSGASRTTLYKWWDSPSALAAESYFKRVEDCLQFIDTGDVAADLRTQLNIFVHLMTEEPAGVAVRELIGQAQTDAVLREAFARSYSRPRRQVAVQLLQRAQQRGQLRLDADLDVVVDQLWGACYHRLLVLGEPVTAELVDRLVDQALFGAVGR